MSSGMIALFISFAVSAAVGPFIIPALLRLKVGQTVRDEGPESHLKKNGTPTMGGIIFLLGFVVSCVVYGFGCPDIWPVLFLTVGFGCIGFVDDFIKVVLKRSLGLRAWQKLLLQLLVAVAFGFWLQNAGISLGMRVPFTGGYVLDFGIFNIPVLIFIVLGTTNGTNFTDGLDGLASSVTAVVALFFGVVAMQISGEVYVAAIAMFGGLLGFLLYNVYPAKVFMGDTGSLALGGFVAGMAYMMQLPIFIAIVGVIYLAEVLSVILQVSYFKLTHGKRIFKMSPIHHHFELCGWSETRVVAVFTIVTILACAVAYAGL